MTKDATVTNVVTLPQEGFVRLETAMAVFGCKKTKFLDGVREGVIPKPHKWGRTSLWDVDEIRAAIARMKTQK